jgi:hypothetical protein
MANITKQVTQRINLSFLKSIRGEEIKKLLRTRNKKPATQGGIPITAPAKVKLQAEVAWNMQEKRVTANKYLTGKKRPKRQTDKKIYPKGVISIGIFFYSFSNNTGNLFCSDIPFYMG